MSTNHFSHLISNNNDKSIFWLKKASSTNCARQVGELHVENMKIDLYLSLYTKLNSKDLNIR